MSRLDYISALEQQLEWHRFTLSPAYPLLWQRLTAKGSRVHPLESDLYALPVRHGDMYYVGREFCNLVERTAQDLPDCYLQQEWLPSQCGFILFHHPLPLPRLAGARFCDFCKDTRPAYEYPCKDFTWKGSEAEGWSEFPSAGSWAACSACSIFIENNDLPSLAERCETSFWKLNPTMPNPHTPELGAKAVANYIEMFNMFMENRIGGRKADRENVLSIRALGWIVNAEAVQCAVYMPASNRRTDVFYPVSYFGWGYGQSMALKIDDFEDDKALDADTGDRSPYEDGSTQHEIKYFAALLLLMNQRLLSALTEPVDRHQRKRFQKQVNREIKTLKVVVLRRKVSQSISDPDGTHPDWSCRWIVRGHWRQQWYPSQGVNNPVWISPYVKGPDDKPVKEPSQSIFAVVR